MGTSYNIIKIILLSLPCMVAVVCAVRAVRGMERKKRAGLDVAPARRGVARVDADSPEGSETHRARGNIAGRTHTHDRRA